MALPIKLKRSSVPSKVPTTLQLDLGEIAINTYDGILYLKKDDGAEAIVTIKEVTENNLSVNTSGFSVSTANTLAGVLSDLDSALGENNNAVKIYTFTLASDLTVITGNDDNAATLVYNSGLESVYINGVLQTPTADYVRTDNNTITFTESVLTGSVVTIIARNPTTMILDSENIKNTTTTNAEVVDTFSTNNYRSAKYFIQITDNTNSEYHVTEVLLLHDGTTVYTSEYSTLFSNSSLGTVTADIVSANVRLLVAATTANSTVKVKRISLEV